MLPSARSRATERDTASTWQTRRSETSGFSTITRRTSSGPKGGGDPTGPIGEAIKKTFGDFKSFQEKFNAAGVGQFGSGWVWLAGDAKGEVKIVSTPNQDNPISQGLNPIFGNDVWEHAYYLKYNNRRPEYLQAWWNVVNWDEINKRYQASIKK